MDSAKKTVSPIHNHRAVQYAFIGWAVLTLVAIAMILAGHGRAFDPSYRTAALNWLVGRDLYDGKGVAGFVYFPQAAILFIPFALLPLMLGEILWRLLSIGSFAFSILKFSRFAGDKDQFDLFPLMSLVTIPFAWDCARNGQSTLIMTAMMLLAVVDIGQSRWWRAALWLSLSIAFKPLSIVFALLVMALYRPMTWRLLLGLSIAVLAPYVLQSSEYVSQQYGACLHNMTMAAHVGVAVSGWTSPFNTLQIMHINVPENIQMAVRIIAAFATLAVGLFVRRHFDARQSAIYIFSLAVMYLILFSPRTENNTYVMLGPVLAFFIANTIIIEKRYREGALLSALSLIMISHRFFERLILPHTAPTWLSPIMAICFAVYLFRILFADQTNYGAIKKPSEGLPGKTNELKK